MSEDQAAVIVKDLHKTFKLPLENHSGIKQVVINAAKRKKGYEIQKVLSGVSFEIKKGEFFGIVGRNGSGKSTLLKLLAGIYVPDSGLIQVNGSLTPFIELGVGFNPELTGYENVFLNGALLGFSRKEMEAMYDDIVSFAELDKFMDQRLKNYSSGMQVRLAFSIAIRAQSDILLLDEVLAVGDEAFQRKCYDYFETLKRKKKTVILVTHDMSAVERFCTKAMLVQDGEIELIGSPFKVAAAYSKSNNVESAESSDVDETKKTQETFDLTIETFNEADKKTTRFTSGDEMTVRMTWNNERISNLSVGIVKQTGHLIYAVGTYQEKITLSKSNQATFKVELNLSEGAYFLQVALGEEGVPHPVVFIDEGPAFRVSRDIDNARWDGITKLGHSWE